MNKAELIEQVQKTLGGETSKRAAGDALDAVLTCIAAYLVLKSTFGLRLMAGVMWDLGEAASLPRLAR